MKNAQKIIRKDPDLMSVMEININDSDIANAHASAKKEEEKKSKEMAKTLPNPKLDQSKPALTKTNSSKKATYGNLFG